MAENAQRRVVAPGVVQNLSMASDLYGDRSNIRTPFDTGAQTFTMSAPGGDFVPQRTVNTHLLAGESEKRPDVGMDFVASFAESSFLPKGFASDQFYFAVTSIALTPVSFGEVEALTADKAMSTGIVNVNYAAIGTNKTGFVAQAGQVLNQVFRATFAGVYIEYLQDGRKCSFVFDQALSIPGSSALNDVAANSLPVIGARAMLPVPFLLSPRNTNQSQEILKVHFERLNKIVDISGTTGGTEEYALVYRLDFQGFFCDAEGNPADQAYTLRTALNASDYKPAQG